MKIGDLVRFESGVIGWENQYYLRNPGIVIGEKIGRSYSGAISRSLTVFWSNSSVTSEHEGYLHVVSEG